MWRRLIDLTGQRFGRLLVLERGENASRRHSRWVCRCDCGGTSIVQLGNLRSGHTISCGCWHREHGHLANLSHGHTRSDRKTPEYVAWQSMLTRCYDPKHRAFKYYAPRGIAVCARWRESFQAFLDDVGLKPSPELTLDRIDNDGSYEPGNVRWATRSEQQKNRRPRTRTVRHGKEVGS